MYRCLFSAAQVINSLLHLLSPHPLPTSSESQSAFEGPRIKPRSHSQSMCFPVTVSSVLVFRSPLPFLISVRFQMVVKKNEADSCLTKVSAGFHLAIGNGHISNFPMKSQTPQTRAYKPVVKVVEFGHHVCFISRLVQVEVACTVLQIGICC